MKHIWFLFFVLIYYTKDGIESSPLTTFGLPPPKTNATERETTAIPSEQDSLESVSIQDLLLSGIDGNEKIQKKIIGEIKDFPINFRNYGKPIYLTTTSYSFPKKLIKFDMDKGYIVYRNVSLSQLSNDYSENAFSISVKCDSSSTAKISLGLPRSIKLAANFSITHPSVETTNEGAITILLTNGAISKQVTYTNHTVANLENTSYQISFPNSRIDVEFDGPHGLIYDKSEDFFDEMESSLKEFFSQQLDEQMNERQLNLPSDCSKIRFVEPNMKKINLPYFNNFLNNLYVIPVAKIETWKGVALSAGPIIIDGFSFNSTELSISKKYEPNYGSRKKLSSSIKTGNLKGKFQWNFNLDSENSENSSSVFYFSIDNITFENNVEYRPNYGQWQNDVYVYIGKTKIKPSSSNSDLNELKFADFVLSEYLKSAISDSLKTSLSNTRSDDTQTYFVRNLFDNM